MLEHLQLIISVAGILFLALLSPGPDFLMVIKNSLQYSRRTGVFTAIGLGGGIAVHVSYCIAGIAVIISQSIFVFTILKLLGALYLIYIGFQAFLAKSSDIEIKQQEHKKDISRIEALKIGFLTNILNPKATLFFMSLFAMFIPSETPNSVLFVLALLMIFMTIVWFVLVAIFFTQPKVQKSFNTFQSAFNKIFGGLLIALGVKITVE